MDTPETAGDIRDFLLELDPKRRSDAYREAAREYMQWAAQTPRNEKATRQAWTRIYEQQRRGRGPLIGEKCPGRGWARRTGSYRLRDGSHVAVEGWLPPAVVKRLDTPLRWPHHEPSSRLSLEVLLAALAVFHDLALPQTPPFMDYPEERPAALGSFLWYLRRAFEKGADIQSLDEPWIDAWGLPIAQDYLARAQALLRAEQGGKRGLPPAGSETPPPLTPDAAAPGEPFYKPKYFQQWDIDDELLRRNAVTGKQYTESKVRRIKKKPASGKGKRAVYWYSEPDARRCWPDLFKIAEDDRTRKESKPPTA
jgi:hypothetical protein